MGGQIAVQINHRKKILALRRLDRLVQSKEFVVAWNQSDNAGKRWVIRYIDKVAYNDLQFWINDHVFRKFEKHTIRQLRHLASEFHIPYYSRMTRKTLISKLIEKGVTNVRHLSGEFINTVDKNEADARSSGCET